MDLSKLVRLIGRDAKYNDMVEELRKLGMEEVLRTGKGVEKLKRTDYGLYAPELEDSMGLMTGELQRRGVDQNAPVLQSYRRSGYRDMNSAKRGLPATEGGKADANLLEQLLEQGIELPYDIKVHRGLGSDKSGAMNELFHTRKPGDEVGNLGFLSTTIDPMIAQDFTGQTSPLRAILEIPAGERFIPLNSLERELLFKPRRTFEVQGIDKHSDGARTLRAKLKPGKLWDEKRKDRDRLIGGGALGAILLNEDEDGQ